MFKFNNGSLRINLIESGTVAGQTYSTLKFRSTYWGISTATPAIDFQVYQTSGAADTLSRLQLFNGDNGKIVMQPTGTGGVGVGTSTPGEKLDVVGNGKFSGSIQVSDSGTTCATAADLGKIRYNTSTGKFQICR
jgi:hypothetical protein